MASDIPADIDIPSLEQKIAEQSAIYNDLKQSGSDPAAMDTAHKALGELKRALGKAKSAASGGKAKDKEKEKEAAKDRILLKTAKVCRSSIRTHSEFHHPIITGHKRLWSL
jgi:histidyl-tRNA synthetase